MISDFSDKQTKIRLTERCLVSVYKLFAVQFELSEYESMMYKI